MGFLDCFFVVVTKRELVWSIEWEVHFNSPHDFTVAVFGGEEVVCLTTRFSLTTLCVLDDGLHQFDILEISQLIMNIGILLFRVFLG